MASETRECDEGLEEEVGGAYTAILDLLQIAQHPWLGRIQIPTCLAVELMTDTRSTGCTFVLKSAKRYTLRAANSTEARAWIETLQGVVGCNGAEEIGPTAEVCRKRTRTM